MNMQQAIRNTAAVLLLTFASAPLLAENLPIDKEVNSEVDESLAHRKMMCVAKSGIGLRGQTFTAVGQNRAQAVRKVMRKCRNHSLLPYTCKIVHCRRIIGRD